MDAIELLKVEAVNILARCVQNVPWDEDDQEEEFQYNLEHDPENAWENLAYYWWAEYKAGADWWCSMAEAAMKLMNDGKMSYAMMRMNHLANQFACECWNPPHSHVRSHHAPCPDQQIKIYPFPKTQPDEEGEYLVWTENEYKAGWELRIWHDFGVWSSSTFDAPVLFWAKKPVPPEGHVRKSMGERDG